jgi:Zn-finger nucleic acid-binding protein
VVTGNNVIHPAESLGLFACAACRKPLRKMNTPEAGELHACLACRAVWMQGRRVEALRKWTRHGTGTLICPCCAREMEERAHPDNHTLRVGFCTSCPGAWIEQSELHRLLDTPSPEAWRASEATSERETRAGRRLGVVDVVLVGILILIMVPVAGPRLLERFPSLREFLPAVLTQESSGDARQPAARSRPIEPSDWPALEEPDGRGEEREDPLFDRQDEAK